jgi:hypothetical protein
VPGEPAGRPRRHCRQRQRGGVGHPRDRRLAAGHRRRHLARRHTGCRLHQHQHRSGRWGAPCAVQPAAVRPGPAGRHDQPLAWGVPCADLGPDRWSDRRADRAAGRSGRSAAQASAARR